MEVYKMSFNEFNNAAQNTPSDAYFQRLKGLYPEHVLNKVIIGVGVGGARTYTKTWHEMDSVILF